MKKIISILMMILVTTNMLSGCVSANQSSSQTPVQTKTFDFNFDVNPETFEITTTCEGITEKVSDALPKMKISTLDKSPNKIAWRYPDKNVNVTVKKENNYLDVHIKGEKEGNFNWPKVSAKSYILPFGEGKYIPSDDKYWKEFLNKAVYSTNELLSMKFFALNAEKHSIVYVIENMFNNEISFDTKDKINFTFNHEFTRIDKAKEYGFRIYLTDTNPVEIAHIYKNYLQEKGEFTSFAERSATNKNIEKLYGAPHIYWWNKNAILEENIKWQKLINSTSSKEFDYLKEYIKNSKMESFDEIIKTFDIMKKQGYLDKYQKNLILSALNNVIASKDFYNPKIFKSVNKDVNKLNELELYDLNKNLLKSILKDSVAPINEWATNNTTNLLKEMNSSGIKKAWIGFDDWTNGYKTPDFVKYANDNGYLIGPYDSYHSIQKNGEKDAWGTSVFKDSSLFENATVTNKNGEKIAGFLGKGRQLNPTLSMPSVKDRLDTVLKTGIKYNSWFIDCDAAGEVFDDYTIGHLTTQAEDTKARIKRMEYIRDNHNMIIGSEGGCDYAGQAMAFAHGLETPVIADKEMRQNKDSKYYIGAYWSPQGIPARYIKQVPLKDLYQHIYFDATYNLPLFKLVYNNSIITTHHWEQPSFKFKEEVNNNMLKEILYNVPPLYHIDENSWKTYKNTIIPHVKIWSNFSEKAIKSEMTNFQTLSADKLIQMTEYGKDLKVIANFSNKEFNYNGDVIKAKSLIIYDKNNKINYTPKSN